MFVLWLPLVDGWRFFFLSCADLTEPVISYPLRRSVPVLRNISFVVPGGTATAIVGSSGCGKSTVLGLLQQMYQPTRGRITLGGADITTLDVAALRQHIAVVDQGPQIFPRRSIRGNVLVGTGGLPTDNGCDQQQVEYDLVRSALADAGLLDFCDTLPEGVDTWVGGGEVETAQEGSSSKPSARQDGPSSRKNPPTRSGGGNLSGGQRARLAIARAIARRAPLLLLDEAFSNLDGATQANVRLALRRLIEKKGQTVIAVSHQLHTLGWVDQIIVLENGGVAEIGSFKDLASRPSGRFAAMLHAGRAPDAT